MSYTDPSGYFFKSLFKKINKALGKFAPIVSIALSIWAPWGTKFWASVGTGFISGGIATGSLRGALAGAFTAGMFHEIGTQFQSMTDSAGVLSAGARIGKTFAHGIAGGISSVLNGGKFGHGFASAGFTQAFSGAIDKIGGRIGNITKGDYFSTANRTMRIMASAVVGGTASSITGGKFANGAVTGAFSRGFNDEAHKTAQDREFKEALFDKTRKIGLSVSIPSKVVDLFGGDTGGHDVGFEFGLVFGSDGDIGAYYSQSASKGLSVPFSGNQLPISRVGGFITFGQQQGSFYDFAGTGDFVSAGGGPLVIDGTLSDSGKYGFNVNLGGGYSAAGGRSNTTVISFGKGLIESGCEAFAC